MVVGTQGRVVVEAETELCHHTVLRTGVESRIRNAQTFRGSEREHFAVLKCGAACGRFVDEVAVDRVPYSGPDLGDAKRVGWEGGGGS